MIVVVLKSIFIPRENLIVAILEVSFLLFSHRVNKLVLMEVVHFLELSQVRSKSNQFCEIQHR